MINFHPSSGGELKPRITVIGVGGAGGNAVNNMIQSHLEGVEFIVANTDAQAMSQSRTDRRIQLGAEVTQGLGAGARPDIGRAAAEETLEEVVAQLQGSNMVFITAGMGGGTGTGAAPVIARAAREHGILTVGVVTKPFSFEGQHRMRLADQGIEELSQYVDTLIIIPNQNLFRIASERTTFADAFKMADDVLYSGVRGVTDLMIMPGLINLDFADIRTVMGEMGKAMMGTGEAEGDKRALDAAEAAISNPLLEDISMKGARGVLINITGGMDMTLFEVDEAANRIRDEVDPEANIIFGSTFDEKLNGKMRVSVVATGIDAALALPKATVISVVTEQKRPLGNVQPLPAANGLNRPTLAEQVAGTTRFHTQGSAALATNPDPMGHPHQQPEPALRHEPMLRPQPPQPQMTVREQPSFAAPQQAQPRQQTAPLPPQNRPRMEPTQGNLRMEQAPRQEPHLDLRQPAPQQTASAIPQPRDVATESSEMPELPPNLPPSEQRRASFLNRLAASVKHAHAHNGTAPAAPPVAQRTAMHQEPAAPQQQYAQPAAQPQPQGYTQQPAQQPARVSPAERPAPGRTDEDLLDIPAFLRRQAN